MHNFMLKSFVCLDIFMEYGRTRHEQRAVAQLVERLIGDQGLLVQDSSQA